MRILFILYFDIETTQYIGIKKKVINQISAFRKLGNEVDVAYKQNDLLILKSENKIIKYNITKGVTNYRTDISKRINQLTKENNYDITYIRFPGSIDFSTLAMFSMLKKNGTKILLELPTYPIGGELIERLTQLKVESRYFSLAFYSLVYSVHRVCSRQAHKYIDKIVTFMPYERIWNIPTIVIDNGVNISDYKGIGTNRVPDNRINLLAVANVANWHGYDRVIEGLYNYYQTDKDFLNYEIIFTIVGDSPILEDLKKRVNELYLNGYVQFLGFKDGEELYKIYEKTDLAISSLGMHRINVINGSTLKTKEYCAYGIPFILGYNEKTISEDFCYSLTVPANDEPIRMRDIVDFYQKVQKIPNYSEEMHRFARENFDWKEQMEKVIINTLS